MSNPASNISFPIPDTPREKRMRERMQKLEKTLDAFRNQRSAMHAVQSLKRLATLESALLDVVFVGEPGEEVERLVKHGVSAPRAEQIVALLMQKFS